MRCPAYALIDRPARDEPVTDVVAVADGEHHRSGRTVLIFRQLRDLLARVAVRVGPLRAIDEDAVDVGDVAVVAAAVLVSISNAISSVLYDRDRGRPTDEDDLLGLSSSAAAENGWRLPSY